jgi:hypothetical protein
MGSFPEVVTFLEGGAEVPCPVVVAFLEAVASDSVLLGGCHCQEAAAVEEVAVAVPLFYDSVSWMNGLSIFPSHTC